MHGRRLHSPEQGLERAGARSEPQPEPSLRPRGGGPARSEGWGRQAGLAGSGPGPAPGNRRVRGARREAAGRPGRLAPVPTIRVSHGWSEVLFLKRLQGGHKQPPTSLPMRAVDCQPCVGQGAWAVHLAGGTGWGAAGLKAGGRGVPHHLKLVAGRGPSSPGLEAQGRKAGECCCPAAGNQADQSSGRWRKLWSWAIRGLPQASQA